MSYDEIDYKTLANSTRPAFIQRREGCANCGGILTWSQQIEFQQLCSVCGRRHHYKLMDGGHFVPRQHLGTRYSPNNVWSQCKFCNMHKHGNHADYRARLVLKIGRDMVEALEANRDDLGGVWIRDLLINTYIESKKIIKEMGKTA